MLQPWTDKKCWHKRLKKKNLGLLKHFLGLEADYLKGGWFFSQHKYATEIVAKEISGDNKRKVEAPVEPNVKLRHCEGMN